MEWPWHNELQAWMGIDKNKRKEVCLTSSLTIVIIEEALSGVILHFYSISEVNTGLTSIQMREAFRQHYLVEKGTLVMVRPIHIFTLVARSAVQREGVAGCALAQQVTFMIHSG